MKKIYIYPNYDHPVFFYLFRVAGAGLGNLLYDFANCIVLREKIQDSEIIWPEWNSFKLGPFIRNERDKRLYRSLFRNKGLFISGIKRVKILIFHKKFHTKSVDVPLEELSDGSVVMFANRDYSFAGLHGYREQIRKAIISITKEKLINYTSVDFRRAVCVHIRLGDFAKATQERLETGAVSTALPIQWYINIINSLKEILPSDIKYYVFSDERDDAIGDVISIDGVQRLFFGSAISDMLAMSESKLIVHTWSTFALWSRFLGNISGITYPTFIHEPICDDDYTHFSLGSYDGEINSDYVERIKSIF